MKSLVFFPGRYSINPPGAVSVVTRNLFPDSPSELNGTIIGMGRLTDEANVSETFHQIDLLPEYRRKSIVYRSILNFSRKISRTFPPARIQSWVNEELSILADKLAAKHLSECLKNDPNIEVAVGYTGHSLLFGQVAKAAGIRYAIHSQFCHPYIQNTLVADAYRSLGLKPPIISESSLRRSLATIALADKIWCPSDFVRQSLIDNGVPKNKTFVSFIGIDVESFRTPKTASNPNESFLILFVGNVGIQKGVHILLQALMIADIENIKMVFNGQADNIAQQIIQEYKSRLSAKRITILVDPGDPRRYQQKASIFVLPSVHDSFGIVVVEAMAAGLPVIISNQVGAKEIVQHGKNGFIFSSGDCEDLAKRIEFFYYDQKAQEEFGKASLGIIDKYNKENCSERIMANLFFTQKNP